MTAAVDAKKLPRIMKKSPRLRILVVDDEPLIRWSLIETLQARRCQVVEAADARAALAVIGDSVRPFDVVILDYRLPDSDDLSLLRSIRQRTPGTQVILMTAFGTPEVARDAIDLGAFRVVSKPFDVNDVANLVAAAATTSIIPLQ